MPDLSLKRSISSDSDSSSCGPAQPAIDVCCVGLPRSPLMPKKNLAKLRTKSRKKRMVRPKVNSKSDGLKQKTLSKFFKSELGPAKPCFGSSYEADKSGCSSTDS